MTMLKNLIYFFNAKNLYQNTNKEVKYWFLLARCCILGALLVLSLFAGWLKYFALMLAAVYIAFETRSYKISYLLFLLPFYNVFRASENQIYWLSFLYLFYFIITGIGILYDHFKNIKRIDWKFVVCLLACLSYFVLPFRTMALMPAVIICTNFAFIGVLALSNQKYDIVILIRLLSVGVLICGVVGVFALRIEGLKSYVGMFKVGIPSFLRLVGFDRDPNYFSMSIVLILSSMLVFYYNNKITFKTFVLYFVAFSILGIMTASKMYFIIYALYLVILATLFIVKFRKAFKGLVVHGLVIMLGFLVACVSTTSYIKLTLERAGVSLSFIDGCNKFVYDIGDMVSSLNAPITGGEKYSEFVKNGGIIDEFYDNGEGMDASSLTTGRSDIWKEYIKAETSSVKSFLFGLDASGNLLKTSESPKGVASHNTLLQIVYYYGIIGVLIILSASVVVFLRFYHKNKFDIVKLIPMLLIGISMMALDNLMSLRTPLFIICIVTVIASEKYNVKENAKELKAEDASSQISV